MVVRARQAKRCPSYAQLSSNLPSSKCSARVPVQGRQTGQLKHLVTNIHVCLAYSMYLSDKCTVSISLTHSSTLLITLCNTAGDKATFVLVAQVPVDDVAGATAGAGGCFTWLVNTQNVLRRGSDEAGDNKSTPLYSLRRPIKRYRRLFRDAIRPEPAGDGLSV